MDISIVFDKPLKRKSAVANWQVTLKTDLLPLAQLVLTTTSTYQDGGKTTYFAYRYPVVDLPPATVRPSGKSEIVLILPRNISISNSAPTFNTYSYLPVNNYGFKVRILLALLSDSSD